MRIGTRRHWPSSGALRALAVTLLVAWAPCAQAPAAAQAQVSAQAPASARAQVSGQPQDSARPRPAAPRASANNIERQLMCVTCKIPLAEAESPQAERERAFLKQLVGEGLSEAQIKRALVSEYGPAVLALPSAHGFDLAVYVVPPVAVLAALLGLLLVVRRWRRDGGRRRDAWASRADPLSAADAERLERDMAEYET